MASPCDAGGLGQGWASAGLMDGTAVLVAAVGGQPQGRGGDAGRTGPNVADRGLDARNPACRGAFNLWLPPPRIRGGSPPLDHRHALTRTAKSTTIGGHLQKGHVMLKVLVWGLLGASAVAVAQVDADIPAKFANTIKPEVYHRLRNEHLNMLRGLPADPSLRQAALDQMTAQKRANRAKNAAMASALSLAAPVQPPVWAPIGPAPIPNGQVVGALTVSGRVTAFVMDPTNSNKVYLGTAQGGVYRSTDGGTTWVQIFDGAATSAIGALALAPSNPTILYVGTGEANGSADSYAGVGLYRVDNCDSTATLVGPINPVRNYVNGASVAVSNPVFTGRSISSIAVHPTDPGTLFVGVAGGVMGIGGESPLGGTVPPLGMRGLYRLTNATSAPGSVAAQKLAVTTAAAGFDLPNTGNRNIDSIFMEPGNPSTLVVWVNGSSAAGDGGLYRSTNAMDATPTFGQVQATATSSARGILRGYKEGNNPAVIYVATGESTNGRVRRSVDGGATWSGALSTGSSGSSGFCGGQCFYNIGLDVIPGPTTAVSDDIIVLGGNVAGATSNPSRLFAKSVNGGASFTESSSGLHADTHFIAIDRSNTSVIYHGNDGGVFKSTNAGSNWVSLNGGLNTVQFSGLAVHPTDPKWSIGGTQDNGTNMRRADGTWFRVDYGDGGYALIDRNATDTTNITLYHTYFNQTNNLIGFGRVLSAGCAVEANWAFKGIYGGSVDPTFYCDGSDSFNGIPITDAVLFYAPMELGPGNPNTVYFGAGGLYRSTNRGDTMTLVSARTSSPVSTIAVSPQDDNYRIFGRADGSVWFTTTGGTPTQLTGLPTPAKYVARVKFDPRDKNTAYIALGGFFGSTSGSNSHVWRVRNLSTTPVLTALNSGLPDVPVNAFAVDPADSNKLYAGTDIGVYATNDGGASWNPYGSDAPVVAVFGMEIQPVSRQLRIATHGRGMWEVAIPAADVTSNFTVSSNLPAFNRATGKWTLSVTVKNNGAAANNLSFAVDNLAAGWTFANADGYTSLTAPAGSGFKLVGAVGAGASATFQLQFDRVGTPTFSYTPRLLEGAPR